MIPVTKPFLPPIAEYQEFLSGIWQRNWLTNNGPLVKKLEEQMSKYLGLEKTLFVSNGTIALQLAIKALNITKEIITTPFSYVATTSSIVWEGCTPVFVDIDKRSFNIDPSKIEAAITSNTEAILATHCFGNPCDIDAIEKIAKKHHLKVIYDAAHCFGTLYKGKSVFEYGDISTASFHATKVFHTVEGGAVFTKNRGLLKSLAFMRNFGHNGPERYSGIGINAKNSELHAAMGLINLNYVNSIIQKRKFICKKYDHLLEGLNVTKHTITENSKFNYGYYPILFESETVLLKMKNALEKQEIFPRRYFYPSLSSLDYVMKQSTLISDNVASRILCLPLYHELNNREQELISNVLITTQNNL